MTVPTGAVTGVLRDLLQQPAPNGTKVLVVPLAPTIKDPADNALLGGPVTAVVAGGAGRFTSPQVPATGPGTYPAYVRYTIVPPAEYGRQIVGVTIGDGELVDLADVLQLDPTAPDYGTGNPGGGSSGGGSNGPVQWADVQGRPATFPPAAHTHDEKASTAALDAEATARVGGDQANATAAAAAQTKADAALPRAGGTMTGPLVLAGDPTNVLHAATRQWVLAQVSALVGGIAPADLDTFVEIALRIQGGESAVTALTNVVAGKQPIDDDLTAIAGLATTATGRALLTIANAAELRTAAGLGDVQTQLDAKQATAQKGQANGYASLGADGLVPAAQLPVNGGSGGVPSSGLSPLGAAAYLRAPMSQSTQTATADQLQIAPIPLQSGIPMSGLVWSISAVTAAGTVDLVVYDSDAQGRPRNLVANMNGVTADTAAHIATMFPAVVNLPAGLYWWGLVSHANVTYRTYANGAAPYALWTSTPLTSTTVNPTGYVRSGFAAGPPASLTGLTLTSDRFIPLVFPRVEAA